MNNAGPITRLVFDRVKKQFDGASSIVIEVHRGEEVTLQEFPMPGVPMNEHQIRTITTPTIIASLTGESSESVPEIEWPSYWPK